MRDIGSKFKYSLNIDYLDRIKVFRFKKIPEFLEEIHDYNPLIYASTNWVYTIKKHNIFFFNICYIKKF